MKKPVILVTLAILFAVIGGFWFVSTGFRECACVLLEDYSVSEDGSVITLEVELASSAGYVRSFSNSGGGVKPHYLTFRSTFGGINSSLGAKSEFQLSVAPYDNEVWFNRPDGGFELVLTKDMNTGVWSRPADAAGK